ncbi:MAG: class I SAM-dependent methyltransferase [Anaerolineales bacterium]|jgi:ubiquinone/menaquinone biosynthesis C-methylase UbiE
MHERRFHGQADRLRSPQRLELLEVARVVALCLEDLEAETVLDVGAGTGVFAEAFSQQGLAVSAIDVNPDLLEIARRYAPQATFRQAPAEAIPFPDRSFDLVFLGHVLHETDERLRALQEARRLARKRVVILEWPYLEEEHGPPLEHRLKPEEVLELGKQAGFEAVETLQLRHMVLFRMGR